MKIGLARCLAGTLGCGGLAVLTSLLSALLTAGGDDAGGRALRVAAMWLGAIAAVGVITLVLLLTASQLGLGETQPASPPADGKST